MTHFHNINENQSAGHCKVEGPSSILSRLARNAEGALLVIDLRTLRGGGGSLDQQTATSDVLRIISSSPGEFNPVFQTILANATSLCEAKFANLSLCEGDAFRVVAMHNAPTTYAEERGGFRTRFANASCVLEHGLEHRLQLAGRTADDAQNLVGPDARRVRSVVDD
jgi:hypothetical protein